MNNEAILAFLYIVEFGSISAAAQRLFTSQSNISKKLQQLEEELGVPLIYRGRGQRKIELTRYGQEFLETARQWNILWQEFDAIREHPDIYSLSIGCVDLINMITFVPLYQKLLLEEPNLQLETHTYHSSEISRQLLAHTVDLGFTMSASTFPEITSTPLYREKMYLICTEDSSYTDHMRIEDLDPSKEIYLRWGSMYEQWHDQVFPRRQYRMRVGTGTMFADFLIRPEFWAIAPASLARYLSHKKPIRYCHLDPAPPDRICYIEEYKYVRESRKKGIEVFTNALYEYLRQSHSVELYEE